MQSQNLPHVQTIDWQLFCVADTPVAQLLWCIRKTNQHLTLLPRCKGGHFTLIIMLSPATASNLHVDLLHIDSLVEAPTSE